LDVNAEKTKYMVMSRDQNVGQNGYIQIGNKSFETVEQLKYLGTTLTNQNPVHAEIKIRLKSENACYQNSSMLASFFLLICLSVRPLNKIPYVRKLNYS
jgi:hypothetical protein